MLSCDIYDTGEGSVSVYLVWDTWHCINGHHWQTPANTTTHTHSGDKKYKADKWTETVTRSKYSFAAGWDGDCVLNYILSCIKPVTFGWVPAVSPDGPHPISRLTSAQQFKHPPFSIILYNFLHKTPHNGPWWSMCADERSLGDKCLWCSDYPRQICRMLIIPNNSDTSSQPSVSLVIDIPRQSSSESHIRCLFQPIMGFRGIIRVAYRRIL